MYWHRVICLCVCVIGGGGAMQKIVQRQSVTFLECQLKYSIHHCTESRLSEGTQTIFINMKLWTVR